MVKISRKGQGISVIVLDGGHNLTDDLVKMELDSVQYRGQSKTCDPIGDRRPFF